MPWLWIPIVYTARSAIYTDQMLEWSTVESAGFWENFHWICIEPTSTCTIRDKTVFSPATALKLRESLCEFIFHWILYLALSLCECFFALLRKKPTLNPNNKTKILEHARLASNQWTISWKSLEFWKLTHLWTV